MPPHPRPTGASTSSSSATTPPPSAMRPTSSSPRPAHCSARAEPAQTGIPMPFDSTDIRSSLAPAKTATTATGPAAPADYLRFYDLAPVALDGARRWRGRSQNLVVDVVDVDSGAELEYAGGPDETGVILHESATRAHVYAVGEAHEAGGESPAERRVGTGRVNNGSTRR